ncbi:MAG: hypothetical protein R2856_25955 [Caldilineaceae bacterium]|nr:hypothetical protein [Caldilineaceae bacterium]
MNVRFYLVITFLLFVLAFLAVDAHPTTAAPAQQTVPAHITYGFIQDADNPSRVTAVAYSDVSSDNVTVSTGTFTFLLSASTVTAPAIAPAPAKGSFVNEMGVWTAMKITPSLYAGLGFNPADMQGYDLYQVVLSPGSASPALSADDPLPLFSFQLPSDCADIELQVLTNDSPIQQALLANIGANFNNQISMSIDDRPAQDLYAGHQPGGSSVTCVLQPPTTDASLFLPLINR